MSVKRIPLKPQFYIVKMGFAGVYQFLLQNIDCGYSLEPPRLAEAVLTCTNNICIQQKQEKYQTFSVENFLFSESLYIAWTSFRNGRLFVCVCVGLAVIVSGSNSPGFECHRYLIVTLSKTHLIPKEAVALSKHN